MLIYINFTLLSFTFIRCIELFASHTPTHRYGIKQVKGEQRLTGPGAEASDVPGVTAGGGKWPQRYCDGACGCVTLLYQGLCHQ